MSCRHKIFLLEVLVCTVVAAMVGILSDNAAFPIPTPGEAIAGISGEDGGTYLKKRRETKKLFRRMFRLGYDDLIIRHGGKYGLDWLLIASIISQESSFQAPQDSSERQHHGLMQISRETAKMFGADENLTDPEHNIEAGSGYLRHLIDIFTKEGIDSANAVKYALAAYNCGITKVQRIRKTAMSQGIATDKWDDFAGLFDKEDGPTRRYVSEIIDRYEEFKKLSTNQNTY